MEKNLTDTNNHYLTLDGILSCDATYFLPQISNKNFLDNQTMLMSIRKQNNIPQWLQFINRVMVRHSTGKELT